MLTGESETKKDEERKTKTYLVRCQPLTDGPMSFLKVSRIRDTVVPSFVPFVSTQSAKRMRIHYSSAIGFFQISIVNCLCNPYQFCSKKEMEQKLHYSQSLLFYFTLMTNVLLLD